MQRLNVQHSAINRTSVIILVFSCERHLCLLKIINRGGGSLVQRLWICADEPRLFASSAQPSVWTIAGLWTRVRKLLVNSVVVVAVVSRYSSVSLCDRDSVEGCNLQKCVCCAALHLTADLQSIYLSTRYLYRTQVCATNYYRYGWNKVLSSVQIKSVLKDRCWKTHSSSTSPNTNKELCVSVYSNTELCPCCVTARC